MTIRTVTPLAGVWIEILSTVILSSISLSLPLRECGLKYQRIDQWNRKRAVTPLAGVWIEMSGEMETLGLEPRSLPCGSVD